MKVWQWTEAEILGRAKLKLPLLSTPQPPPDDMPDDEKLDKEDLDEDGETIQRKTGETIQE